MKRLLLLGLLLSIFFPVFTGEAMVNIYALSVEENGTNIGLEFSNCSYNNILNTLMANIEKNEKFEISNKLYVPEKDKLILFIHTKNSFPLNELENFIVDVGFIEIIYKGKLINTKALSEDYKPEKTLREQAINKDEFNYRLQE